MTCTIYALLVGIDHYPHPISPLQGCVNDITVVAEYLQKRVAVEDSDLHIRMLKDQEATRQAVITGFQEFLCQASDNDVALFYYSGHGSQEEAPPEFWHLEPDHLDETLVCWDSRMENGWDLADKELAHLIAQVGEKNPHVVVILDCCHSGAGTRTDWQNTTVRRVPTDRRHRPVNSFIFSLEAIHRSFSPPNPDQNPSDWFVLSQGEHILLAACRDNEEAKEYYGNNQHRGVFSYFLMDTLQRANGNLTYRDLYKRASALVRRRVAAQSPQLEATNSANLNQPFLGTHQFRGADNIRAFSGIIAEHPPYFTVSFDQTHGWVIDGGSIHGIQPPSGNETTRLALFPVSSTAEQLRQLSQALTVADVTEVLPHLSKLKLSPDDENLEPELTYKAVVTSLPLPPLGVYLEGDEVGVTLVRQALQKAGLGQEASLYISEVADSESAEFRLLAQDEQYLITRPLDDHPLVAQMVGYTSGNAERVIQQLEHIARWTNIATLSNSAASRIPADAVQVQLYQGDAEITGTEIRLAYNYEQGKWQQPTFRVKLTNRSNDPLYAALLDLHDHYSVKAHLFPTGGIWLEPGQEAWALEGQSIYARVSTPLWKQGITESRNLLKLIVSTTEFDATLLEQGNLELACTRTVGDWAGKTTPQVKSTLNRLMTRIQTRDLSAYPEEEDLWDDWVTDQIMIMTVRPLLASPVLNTGNSIWLGAGVELQAHPSLQAKARLTTVTQSSRDLGNLILPAILRENPTVTQPFQFTASRGTDPGLSALELSEIDPNTLDSVTPQTPLTLLVEQPLAEGEYLLPIGYDGEFFLPLGRGQTRKGKTEIRIERLPEPVSAGQRSIQGSIRIFFQKIVTQTLKREFPYPILAVAEVSDDNRVSYAADVEKVKAQVAQAQRIVLYIHGIIGDTRSLVPSIQEAMVEIEGKQCALRENYDLVLTFDYENIHTTIEENARGLKQRLEAVGLNPNHGKTLHIVAHSMGGLVSRWFIEREGGNQVVQHLIMLGTPNAGSPWPTVQAWATTALTIGLNSLSTIALPVKVLGSLVGAIETIDVTLDQMQPDSEFLKSLAASPNPGISYTIIAGNTSIIPAIATSDRLKLLMRKLVEFPFFGQPNDMAVTVQSIKSISPGRLPQPQVYEVACDHLTYFSTPVGLRTLGLALHQALASAVQSITPPVTMSTALPQGESAEVEVEPRVLSNPPKPEMEQSIPSIPPIVSEPDSQSGEMPITENPRGWSRVIMVGIIALLFVAVVVQIPKNS